MLSGAACTEGFSWGCAWIKQPNSATERQNTRDFQALVHKLLSGVAGGITSFSLSTVRRLNHQWSQVELRHIHNTFYVPEIIGATICMGLPVRANVCRNSI